MDRQYWTSAARSLVRYARSQPGALTREIATAGVRYDERPKAASQHLFSLFPNAEGLAVDLGVVSYRRSNLDPYEQFALGAIVALRQPRRIFEIGTYDGATTLLMARAAPAAELFTLDLPPEAASSATEPQEEANVAERGVGARFRDTREAQRITQLYGDSRSFDFGPYVGEMDLVLVDGGHEYDVAVADTRNALRIVSASGAVVWDDYTSQWPGVVQAVDEGGFSVHHIVSTDFAVHLGTPARA